MTEAAARNGTRAATAERWMRAALDAARRALAAGEPPVGACLERSGELVACTHNAVIGDLDITAHAELRAIRQACRALRSLDLAGTRLFVTVEPCPMCVAACHYAGVTDVTYGASLADMHEVTGGELVAVPVSPTGSGASVRLSGGVLRDDCRALLSEWARRR